MTALQVVQPVPLHEAARERYLNYAMSVITSRALPDVRDGLKPVQRRILYTMFNEMSLRSSARYRKCAAVVGEVMGKFHPHGDSSIYEALVRMAQSFSLRAPLIDGQGNFGSLDGDNAAAMRYTECKLRPLADELLTEIKKRTVDFRPNYDGQRFEPIVLPAQFPQLLVNGSEGIAVGMATKIPPHNLAEVVDAAVALIDDGELGVAELLGYIQGPDFPTGGRIINDRSELVGFYTEGRGTLRVRATFEIEKEGRRKLIIINSIPYGLNKARLLERIGHQVQARKLPQVVELRDESTDDVRIVLELKVGSSPDAVMAYLFKHTPLESTWAMNLNALVPSRRVDVATPQRLDLVAMLRYWLDFRFETVQRRFQYDLTRLLERIHILEGFEKVFDALDEAIVIIRGSEGKRDAAEQLIERFELSDAQTEAILELKLYRLAKLEILLILEELEEKRTEAARIEAILASDRELWAAVRSELLEVKELYADPRRTSIGQAKVALEYNEEAFIVKEETYVVVTRSGWIKRQSSFSDVSKIRVRDEDEIGWLVKCHTRSTMTFFSSDGSAFVTRVDSIPATTGYGEPLQRAFAFADGGRVVGVISHDARHRPVLQEVLALPGGDDSAEVPPPPYAVALTASGRSLRFPLASHEAPSNRCGRRYMRVDADDSVLAVYGVSDHVLAAVATSGGRAMLFSISEIPVRRGGKGVIGIKTRPDDRVMAFELCRGSLDGPTVTTGMGRALVVRERKFGVSKRGGKGNVVLRRGTIDNWSREPVLRLGTTDSPVGHNHDGVGEAE